MNSAMSKLTTPPTASMSDSSIGGSGLGTMAESTGSAGMASLIPRSVTEKAKQIEREMLMERIRAKAGQQRSFLELSRAMRMAMLEKRYALDAVEKSNLQKSLERLQKHIKVKTRAGLVERLEKLSKQLGMKFMEDSAGLFISTDMFYLEIILDSSGKINDVKVHHECKIEQTSCKELVNCLNNGDFADFTAQLEGLSAIYQLNAEPKVKTKAFVALQAMETDLLKLYQWQSNNNRNSFQRVAESSVGLVLPRRGGHAMRLTYFVSPYDFINLETQKLEDPGIEGINAKQLGFSVTVNLEASSANKLQIASTVTFGKDPLTGIDNGQPIFAPMNQSNSMLLPATFVLRLNKPLPVCCDALQKLIEPNPTTGSHKPNSEASSNMNLLNLIAQTALDPQQVKGNLQKGLFVNLPDSTHCYFFTEHKDFKGTLLTSVPFTEPAQLPKIIEFLKKQALFFTLITSCVRPQSRMGHDMDSTVILEVNAISYEKIAVSLQHPYEESLATVEFDLSAGRGLISCSIYSLYADYTEAARKMSLIVQKSLSIPVTIRAILRYWDKERLEMFQKGMNAASGSGGGNSGLLAQAAYGLQLPTHLPMGNENSSDTAAMGHSNTNRMNTMGGVGSNASASATGGVAGYLKFKQEPAITFSASIKSEDFNDHGKTAASMAVANSYAAATAAGAMTTTSPSFAQSPSNAQMLHPTAAASLSQLNKASDMEIADKYKNIWKDKTPNLKGGQMSVTPLGATDGNNLALTTAAMPPQTAGLDVKRTGGIEIIPLTSANQQMSMQNQALPTLTTMATSSPSAPHSTITITPINSSAHSSAAPTATGMATNMPTATAVSSSLPLGVKRPAGNDADVTASSSSNSSTSSTSSLSSASGPPKEKKRKKKRDDSPMGPPEKVYSRQNSPSSSPVGAGGSSLPNSALSTRPSPKHSPVYSSPKHTNTASNSPKSPFGTHSPKHGSSGKPSMSTLKSVAVTAVTSTGSMKSSREKPPPPISTSATLVGGSNIPTAATATAGMSGALMAPSMASKSSHLGLAGLAAPVAGLAGGSQSVAGLPQQLKTVAGLNQYLSGYGSSGNSSPSAIASALSSSGAGEMTAASIAAASAALALRKSQGIPPPPPVNMANMGSVGNSGIGASGAGAAVSSMTSQQTQQQLQPFHQQHQQQEAEPQQQMLSLHPPFHGSDVQQSMPPATTTGQVLSNDNAVNVKKIETPTSLSSQSGSGSSNENIGTEYKVKSSQEGLKMTINKTNSMPATNSTQASTATTTTTTSPAKRHTGLKPGVLSGPASKKGWTSPNSQTFTASTNSTTTTAATSTPSSFNNTSASLSSTPSLMSNFSQTTNENIMRLMHYAAAMTSQSPAASTAVSTNFATTTTTTNVCDMASFPKLSTPTLPPPRNGSTISMLAANSSDSNSLQSSALTQHQQQRNQQTLSFSKQAQHSTIMSDTSAEIEKDKINDSIAHLSNPSK